MNSTLETAAVHLTLLLYLLAWGFSLAAVLNGKRRAALISQATLGSALTLHSIILLSRGIAAGRAPFTNLYESLLIFSWGAAALSALAVWKRSMPALSCATLPWVGACLGYAAQLDNAIKPLPPALHSGWLIVHVTLAILAYGSFAVAGGSGALYLLMHRFSGRRSPYWPSLASLDELTARAINFGFPCLILVIGTGAIWAQQAWGAYWSWDPKETWALITAIFYAFFLHARRQWQWRDDASAWMAVAGLAVVIFCYLGVNLLMSGLHSYASPAP